MQLFHYHLVTSRVRQVEARYVGKLAFELVARHGRIGEDYQSFEAGVSWEELDLMGFKLRLTELERGAVNVVVQPGQWELPRVDHLGLGGDYDGAELFPVGMEDVAGYPRLIDELRSRGWSEPDLHRLGSGNVLRALRDTWVA